MVEAVIFDYNRTLVQGEETPPKFFPETLGVLKTLKKRRIKLAVVSVGGDNPTARHQEFDQLGLRKYISVFKVVGKDERKDLQPILDELQVQASACVVVGDRVRKEIVEGNKVGAVTVWLEQGKFSEEEKPKTPEAQPKFTINNLSELIPIIDSLA
ncbi:HAD family hydrolase [Candidatus Daviesbacteria bacterium]|nr:HAD family hydrolase [Candidatus Daviesbacteria bacterium]